MVMTILVVTSRPWILGSTHEGIHPGPLLNPYFHGDRRSNGSVISVSPAVGAKPRHRGYWDIPWLGSWSPPDLLACSQSGHFRVPKPSILGSKTIDFRSQSDDHQDDQNVVCENTKTWKSKRAKSLPFGINFFCTCFVFHSCFHGIPTPKMVENGSKNGDF